MAGLETFYSTCAACHYFDAGLPSLNAPNLFGIVGRKAAQLDDFGYSPQIADSGIVWTEAALNTWIEDPVKMLPGTLMIFPGLAKAEERADVIAFLQQNR